MNRAVGAGSAVQSDGARVTHLMASAWRPTGIRVAAMSSPASPTASEPPAGDDRTRLLGLLAYAELSTVEQLAGVACLAPSFDRRVGVLDAAGARMDHHRVLVGQLVDAGADPVTAMEPHQGVVDDFHIRTAPRGWPEALLKAWATEGLASDFRVELGRTLPDVADRADRGDGPTRLADRAPQWLAEVLHNDPTAQGRLALWARRLVGELMTRAQRLAADDEGLAVLVTGASPGSALVEVHAMIAQLLQRHNERMATAGLPA
ncbi:MAG TPA: ferritin-like fold-containing protein [Bacillota bacterium]|nr:ferritin-like fold-containing protein [Bacillota bacterium]